jgi:hypothetical protein
VASIYCLYSRRQGETLLTFRLARGPAVEGSLDLDLIFWVLSSFPAMAAWSLSWYDRRRGQLKVAIDYHENQFSKSDRLLEKHFTEVAAEFKGETKSIRKYYRRFFHFLKISHIVKNGKAAGVLFARQR